MHSRYFSLFAISTLLLVSHPVQGEPIEIQRAKAVCRQKKGMFVTQGATVGCFDPKAGVVNDYYSSDKTHRKPEKEDFDLLRNQNIHFYRLFREYDTLTVCNFTDGDIYSDFRSSMDFLSGRTPIQRLEKMKLNPDACTSDSSHMFALIPDRKTAEMAVGICATPTGRPYYDDEAYGKAGLESLRKREPSTNRATGSLQENVRK